MSEDDIGIRIRRAVKEALDERSAVRYDGLIAALHGVAWGAGVGYLIYLGVPWTLRELFGLTGSWVQETALGLAFGVGNIAAFVAGGFKADAMWWRTPEGRAATRLEAEAKAENEAWFTTEAPVKLAPKRDEDEQ